MHGTGESGSSLSDRADALEHEMLDQLNEQIATKSLLYNLADGKRSIDGGRNLLKGKPNARLLMGNDPRLPVMPEKPTLIDFFTHRFASAMHLLQSAAKARNAGLPEKQIFACLLHDIAVSGFIRADHGYWGAQLLAPYVDEEVTWAIRAHQALRFYPDESVGYAYPELYIKYFGADYKPDGYIEDEYKAAVNHKWYMTARMITVYDIYSFDPDFKVELSEFTDIIGRNFKQPKEGLGFDGSPVAHMWRTLIRPTKFL